MGSHVLFGRRTSVTSLRLTSTMEAHMREKYGYTWKELPPLPGGRCGCCACKLELLCCCGEPPLELPPELYRGGAIGIDDGMPLCPHGYSILVHGHDPFALILHGREAMGIVT